MNEALAQVPTAVPIFPLPEVVLFPQQVLPLHIFEPRYRVMVSDALASKRVIAIGLLKPGYEPSYFTSHAPIHPLVGLGRIIEWEELDNGKCNILLRGKARASIVEEIPGSPYRRARIKTLETTCTASAATQHRLRQEVCETIRRHLRNQLEDCEQYFQLIQGQLSLGDLTDLIAGGLPVVGELRQGLLAERDAAARARMLLGHLHTLGSLTPRAHRIEQPAEANLN